MLLGSRITATVPLAGSERASSSISAPLSLARKMAGRALATRGSSWKLMRSARASRPSSRASAISVGVSGSPGSRAKRRRS